VASLWAAGVWRRTAVAVRGGRRGLASGKRRSPRRPCQAAPAARCAAPAGIARSERRRASSLQNSPPILQHRLTGWTSGCLAARHVAGK